MTRRRNSLPRERIVACGKRVELAAPAAEDEDEFLALRRASWEFLAPWEPDLPGIDPLGHSYFARYLRSGPEHRRVRWLVRSRRSGAIRGSISLGELDAGRATIGYWIGARFARRGLMREALALALQQAFEVHGVRTVEAYVLKENEPSRALLRKLGFALSGVARAYRRMRGEERDHERWVLNGPSRAGSESPD